MGAISLENPVVCDGAEIEINKRVSFVTPTGQWHYALLYPLPKISGAPAILEITLEVENGSVGIGCTDESQSRYTAAEVSAHAANGYQTVRVMLDDVDEVTSSRWIVLRNLSDDGAASSGRIKAIELGMAGDIDPMVYKRARALQGYWHYEFELGNGVRTKTTIPGSMGYMKLVGGAMRGLLADMADSAARPTMIDVGCASGYNSFEIARHFGAVVDACDVNPTEIAQAKFVQSCFDDEAARSVNFFVDDLMTIEAAKRYDFFYCSGVMYHLENPVAGARQLYGLCGEGGVIHSCVNGDADATMRLADGEKDLYCFSGEFALVPSAKMLEDILVRVGFKSVEHFEPGELIESAERSVTSMSPEYEGLLDNHTAFYRVKK